MMFVVTGLHTKRRPYTGTDNSSPKTRTRKQRVNLLPVVPQSHQRPRPAKQSASSSGQAVPRVSELKMTRNNTDAGHRIENRCTPIKVSAFGRVAPARVRKFIPKPLILVERRKARQLTLELSPPVSSVSPIAPGSLTRPKTAATTPFSTHVTPTMHRMPTCSTLSSGSHSSSGVSFWLSFRNEVVFGSGFGMRSRAARPMSAITLDDNSSSTDTFVADSPCYAKQPTSKVPLLIATTDTADLVHWTCQSTDTFEPAKTSTPFAPSQLNTNDIPSPTAFPTSAVYSGHPLEQIPGLSDSFKIISSTSRAVYSFNAPRDAYIVKLPNSGSAVSLSNRTPLPYSSSTATSCSKLTSSPPVTLTNAPKPVLDLKRLSSRAASPSPTLVLDGVFALPQPSPSSSLSSRRALSDLPRPRKPTSRRPPLADRTNMPPLAITSSFQPRATSPTSSLVHPGPESPRSKLAHVLTAHAQPQALTRVRGVPPLVRGIQASNNPRTQCEIEGLRVRRVVGLGRGGGDGGSGATERMSLAGVGIVAKLRARWETGMAERCGSVEGCA